jgi:hypothetical protein
MSARTKTIDELSLAAKEKFGRQLTSWGTVCIGSGDALQQYPVEELERFFLEAAVCAALESCTADFHWFMQQTPKELAKQFFSKVVRAAFASVHECNHDWLRRLIERPGVADRLEGYLEKAFSAKQKIAPLAPQPETAELFHQIKTAMLAGRNVQVLVTGATGLNQAAIAKRIGMTESMVSRILCGGKGVERANVELLLEHLARLQRS